MQNVLTPKTIVTMIDQATRQMSLSLCSFFEFIGRKLNGYLPISKTQSMVVWEAGSYHANMTDTTIAIRYQGRGGRKVRVLRKKALCDFSYCGLL